VRAGGGEGLLAESVESVEPVGESVEIGADMQLMNGRVAILVPTHPPMFKFVLEFFDSCMVYNCSKVHSIIFTTRRLPTTSICFLLLRVPSARVWTH